MTKRKLLSIKEQVKKEYEKELKQKYHFIEKGYHSWIDKITEKDILNLLGIIDTGAKFLKDADDGNARDIFELGEQIEFRVKEILKGGK